MLRNVVTRLSSTRRQDPKSPPSLLLLPDSTGNCNCYVCVRVHVAPVCHVSGPTKRGCHQSGSKIAACGDVTNVLVRYHGSRDDAVEWNARKKAWTAAVSHT